VPGFDTGFALDIYDLGLVKLLVGREKDLALVSALLKMGLLEAARLQAHYQQTPMGEREAFTAGRNLTAVLCENRSLMRPWKGTSVSLPLVCIPRPPRYLGREERQTPQNN
jgi:hypothetical protein